MEKTQSNNSKSQQGFINADNKTTRWPATEVDNALKQLLRDSPVVETANLDMLSERSGWDVLKLKSRLEKLKKHYRNEVETESTEQAKPSPTEEELAQAIKFGKQDLIAAGKEALRKLGFVADDNMTRALMHTAFSRLCAKKQGWLFHGASRSGKSAGLDAMFKLIHPGNRLRATSMTEAALYRLGHLDHVFILGGELVTKKVGEDDKKQQVLRQFISEPEISKQICEEKSHQGSKLWVRVEHKVTGSASIVWTSVKSPHHYKDEFALRLTAVAANESEDTTRKALQLKSERSKNPVAAEASEKHVQQAFQNFDLSLIPYKVKIPYAPLIEPKSTHTSIRSIYEQLLRHIEISALMNQHKDDRIKTEDGCIVATLDDYAAAFELISQGAFEVMSSASKGAKEAYLRFYEIYKLRTHELFQHKHVMEYLNSPKSTVSDWIAEWVEEGMAEEDEDNWKHRSRKSYRLLPWVDSNKGFGLVTPAELLLSFAAEKAMPQADNDQSFICSDLFGPPPDIAIPCPASLH